MLRADGHVGDAGAVESVSQHPPGADEDVPGSRRIGGVSGVGDPACDTASAWTFFCGKSRRAYQSLLPVDEAAWARGRGWALWDALMTLVRVLRKDVGEAAHSRYVIEEVRADYRESS